MRVILFGASGMVGQGALREALLDPDVTEVLSIVRSPTGKTDPKLRELVHKDLSDYSAIDGDLKDLDACFFCLGISSAGMAEDAYRKVTYDLTIAAAKALAKHNPGLTFVFVSGAGTDSTEKGRTMWARVKGAAENEILRIFPKGFAFRPAMIQAKHREKSKTSSYQLGYLFMGPLIPLLRLLAPNAVTSTEHIGRAMLRVAKQGSDKRIFESRDITKLGD